MISDLLKEKTKSLHDLVEAKFNSQKIFNGTFNLSDYKNLVRFNRIFLANFEEQTFSSFDGKTAELLMLEKRRKLALIEKDTASLNHSELPVFDINIKNEAEAFGILYVMEGSTLGGNVIAKQLSKLPEFSDITFNYFRCYGENTGSLWKNFKQVLDAEITPAKYEDCISGAEKAYSFLLNLS